MVLLEDPDSDPVRRGLYEAAFQAAGLPVACESTPVRPAGLAAAIRRLRGDDRVLGAELTGAHRMAAVRMLDGLGPEAEAAGVVDTISRRAGVLIGWNTQQAAFSSVLNNAGYDARGRNALVVGTTGLARAVAAALRPVADHLWIAGATLRDASDVCAHLGIEAGGPLPVNAIRLIIRRANLVVSAAGDDSSAVPLPAEWLRPHQFVIDLRYNPPLTPLVRAARLRGARAINGLTMLLYQGLAAFEIWTGRPAPEGPMRQALERQAVERVAS